MRSLEFLAPDFLENPWPTYAKYRREQPIWWAEPIRMFCVFRHEHVRAILKDPRFTVDYPYRITEQLFGRTLIDMEGPEHLRLRHKLSPVLNKTNFDAFAREVSLPHITELVRTAAQQMPLEFMAAVAERVPVVMICHFLGLPLAHERWLFEQMMVLMDHLDGSQRNFEDIARVHAELDEWLRDQLAQLATQDAPATGYKRFFDAISDESLETQHSLYWTFLAGGIETSMCLLGNAAVVLTQHPSWFARLADDPAMARPILDEVLRLEPVQGSTVRFAAQDVELDGVSIRKGQAVNLLYASAARDETVFNTPDAFDPLRTPASTLSFSTGPHACLGKGFTFMNAEIALRALWRALGSVKRADGSPCVIRGASFRKPKVVLLTSETSAN